MAFPPELKYLSEDHFIQQFLIPLLQRLGYSLVVNYHGANEYGKDLVFGEIDRFGHVVYHGLQAKYEPSISLNEIEGLINDARQAFANPFKHPTTGSIERISTFYAVNGGSYGDQSKDHYFNTLTQPFSGNIRVLDGKSLLTLDRWASVNRGDAIRETLTGLFLELRYNLTRFPAISNLLERFLEDAKNPLPVDQFRLAASSNYLTRPALAESLSVHEILEYVHAYEHVNAYMVGARAVTRENQIAISRQSLELMGENAARGVALMNVIESLLSQLGPIASI